MCIEVFNRYETKFLINDELFETIKEEISPYMELDPYNVGGAFYTISNVYYDTRDNYLIRNSLAKPDYKEKLRMRGYGIPGKEDLIFLEIKKKVNGLVNKRRSHVTYQDIQELLATGNIGDMKPYMNEQVIKEIEYMLSIYDLVPKTYIAYDRMAFFNKGGHDLRITFDKNIRHRRKDLRLDKGDYGTFLTEGGTYLMEIKAEKSIPIWVSQLLSKYRIYKTSFSKYGKEYYSFLRERKEA